MAGNLPRRPGIAQDRHFLGAARLTAGAAAVEAADPRIGIDRAARLAVEPQAAGALGRLSLRDREQLFVAMADGITRDGQAIPGLPADDAAYLAKLTGDDSP